MILTKQPLFDVELEKIFKKSLPKIKLNFKVVQENEDYKLYSYQHKEDERYLLQLIKDVDRATFQKNLLNNFGTKAPFPEKLALEYTSDGQLIILEKIQGYPLNDLGLNLYEFNQVLTNLSSLLLNIHLNLVPSYGSLNKDSVGGFQNWESFLLFDLNKQINLISKYKILKNQKLIKSKLLIEKFAQFHKPGSLLHGRISSSSLFVDKNLNILTLADFTQPISGNPEYELASFMVYDGFDRCKRLTKTYFLQGGEVEFDSPSFKAHCLRRLISSLSWRIQNGQLNNLTSLIDTITLII